MNKDVFISYSHKDKEWLTRLQTALKPLLKNNPISVWDDTKIRAGSKWRDEIENALHRAGLAVLLVSQDFLASDFIAERELPQLLEAAQTRGLTIIWIPVTDSLWSETEIAHYQAAHDPNTPLDSLSASEVNKALVSICKEIKRALTSSIEASTILAASDDDGTLEPIFRQAGRKAKSPPSLFDVADFSGKWKRADLSGHHLIIRQTGAAIVVEEYVNLAGADIPQLSGEGLVVGRKAFWNYTAHLGGNGNAEIAISDNGRTLEIEYRHGSEQVKKALAFRST